MGVSRNLRAWNLGYTEAFPDGMLGAATGSLERDASALGVRTEHVQLRNTKYLPCPRFNQDTSLRARMFSISVASNGFKWKYTYNMPTLSPVSPSICWLEAVDGVGAHFLVYECPAR